MGAPTVPKRSGPQRCGFGFRQPSPQRPHHRNAAQAHGYPHDAPRQHSQAPSQTREQPRPPEPAERDHPRPTGHSHGTANKNERGANPGSSTSHAKSDRRTLNFTTLSPLVSRATGCPLSCGRGRRVEPLAGALASRPPYRNSLHRPAAAPSPSASARTPVPTLGPRNSRK